jgi:hypothetical protein
MDHTQDCAGMLVRALAIYHEQRLEVIYGQTGISQQALTGLGLDRGKLEDAPMVVAK